MSDYFATSLDHLMAELRRIELRLRRLAGEARRDRSRTTDARFGGLYVSDEQVDAILSAGPAPVTSPPADGAEASCAAAVAESRRRGVRLRLVELARLFGLSAFDIDTVLVCILPELDVKYQRLYGYLQDDITRKGPTVDLVLRLLGESPAERWQRREAFSDHSALLRCHLVTIHDDHPGRANFRLGRSLQLDERVLAYLLGADEPDVRLQPFIRRAPAGKRLADVVLPDDIRAHLADLVERHRDGPLVAYLHGGYGVGKQATAAALCAEADRPLLSIDLVRMAAADLPTELLVTLVFREARLQGAAVYLEGFDAWPAGDRSGGTARDLLVDHLAECPGWVFLGGERDWLPRGLPIEHFVNIGLPLPSHEERRRLWAGHFGAPASLDPAVNLDELAGRFRFSGGQIADAAAAARRLARWRHPESAAITSEDLSLACRRQSRETLSSLGRRIEPVYRWEDIVLPRDQMEQLHEICGHIRHRQTVYGDWGFGGKLSLGKGLNVLFAGPSGTGKTMAAEIMANELGIDLYKIDLSAVVSKYIGETEKNLEKIFQEGQASNAILFFDEADALFGKRSEVRDSHDRYANIEIAYLLQRMDEYEGMVVLATNLRKNMDEAFARRMHFTVEFPVPEEAERARIWRGMFPARAPVSATVDIAFLARQFKITGGNIKNIVVNAAFLAAQDGGVISMEGLIRATKREHQKMGKLCTEGDFAQYFELVKG